MKQFQPLEGKSCTSLNLLRWKYIISLKSLLSFSQKNKRFVLGWCWGHSAGTPARDQRQKMLLLLFLCSEVKNMVSIQCFPSHIKGNHVLSSPLFNIPKMFEWTKMLARLRKIKCTFSYLKGRMLVWNRMLWDSKCKLSSKCLLCRYLLHFIQHGSIEPWIL